MDASKAFDCVLHAKLCTKLLDRGMNASIVKLLYTWCKTQKFQIVWNGRLSRSFMIEKSVRQGGVLSPYFFNVYMDSLGLMLTDLGVGCRIGRRFSNNLWYADDLVLLAPTVVALQKLIDVCHSYASEHNIISNEKKTVCMRFGTTSAKVQHFPIISINSNNLLWVNNYCYLGYDMSSNFKHYDFNEIDKRCHCVRANMLATRFSKVSEDVKKLLFKTYFSSIYCSSL